jgi:hypothetical protein
MSLERLNAACLARCTRIARDRHLATLATALAFATVATITAAGNPLSAPSPEARRAALCAVLMQRASELAAQGNRLRADHSHDRRQIGNLTSASARAEYNALCGARP